MREIMGYMSDMLPFMLCAVPLIALFRVIRVRYIKTTPGHEVGMFLFLLFLVGLASVTVIPDSGAPFVIDPDRINLRPFLVLSQTWYLFSVNHNFSYFLINFVGNIVMFMPIGFCIPLLWRVSFRKTLLLGFSASLFVELCQLPQARGTDIDDLWINTLGVLLGYAIFYLAQRFWKLKPLWAAA